jgi:hypothetical protein
MPEEEANAVTDGADTAAASEPGRVTVNAALERMQQKRLPGWVLSVIESYAPGLDPRGVAPYYEEAARHAGGYVHYKSIMLDGKPAYFVILADAPRLSPLELQQIMTAWQSWRKSQQGIVS